VAAEQSTPSSKPKRAKKKLDSSHETEKGEASPEDKNILNLPYTDSEEEEEQVAAEYEDLPSPTPKEDQGQQVAETSSSKPKQSRSQKINQLLRRVYELEVVEKEIKKKNEELTERNVELYDYYQDLLEKYDKIKERNKMLMKDNTKLYIKVRLLRLQTMPSKPQPQANLDVETLAEAATSFADVPEAFSKNDEEPDTVQAAVALEEQS